MRIWSYLRQNFLSRQAKVEQSLQSRVGFEGRVEISDCEIPD